MIDVETIDGDIISIDPEQYFFQNSFFNDSYSVYKLVNFRNENIFLSSKGYSTFQKAKGED